MSKSTALLLVLFFLTALCIAVKPAMSSTDVAENTWVSKASMQQARAGLGVAAVNGKIYAIGGSKASGQYPPDAFSGGFLGTNEVYDPETDTWKMKASMPTPRDYFAIVAYQNKIYCIGGAIGFTVDEWGLFHSYTSSGVTEVYDTVTDTWETKTPMPDEGMNIQAHVVNGKIYVMDWSLVYVYDPENDSWASKTRMPQPYPKSSPVSVVVGNKIIVTGEFAVKPYYVEVQKTMIYDTITDSWSEGTSAPTIVTGGAAAATVGVNALQRVYVLGKSVNQVYDPRADAWATASVLPTSRIDFGVAVIDDILYAIGGYILTDPMHGMVRPVAVNEQYFPVGYGVSDPVYVLEHTPPEMSFLSPLNETYYNSSVPLVFTVDKDVSWMSYSLDCQDNITVTGNATLSELPNGVHNITVYTEDTFGNEGASETINFNINVPEPFPTTLVIASIITVVVVGVGLLVSFKKRKH